MAALRWGTASQGLFLRKRLNSGTPRLVSPGTRCQAASSGPVLPMKSLTGNLAQFYYEVQHPALANRTYSKAMKDFTDSAILAYECGYNEDDVRQQLVELKAEDSFKGFNQSECLAFISLVWVTLMLSPKSVKRWAKAVPVTDNTLHQWKGFVAMIVNGYFEQRMAWYPLERLQLEVNAVQGKAEAPHDIAEMARVVFTTLEKVYPQFPSD